MANTYFRFKHFVIHQDKCAMKVTTDGCLFGAYAAQWVVNYLGNNLLGLGGDKYYVLDIGAGTGLLSLMIAQKNNEVIIDAVEIDGNAAEQLADNFNTSPWKNNLQVHQISIQDFVLSTTKQYDLIISNPPFYEQQLKGDNQLKNTAHHSAELTLNDLFACVNKLIKTSGHLVIILPFYRTDEAIKIAENYQLILQEKIAIKQTPKHNYFRSILCFSLFKTNKIITEKIIIKDEQNEYTLQFQQLLKDYYLKA